MPMAVVIPKPEGKNVFRPKAHSDFNEESRQVT
jgi:hypothetical protein